MRALTLLLLLTLVHAADGAEAVRIVPQLGWTEAHEQRAILSPDEDFAALRVGHTLRIYDRRNERLAWFIRDPVGRAMAFSPDGRHFASFGEGGFIIELDAGTRVDVAGVMGRVVAFSPDRELLAVASGLASAAKAPPEVVLLDLTGQVVQRIDGTLPGPATMEFSEDGSQLIQNGAAGNIYSRVGGTPARATIDLKTGEVQTEILGRAGRGRLPQPARTGDGGDRPESTGLHVDPATRIAVYAVNHGGHEHQLFAWDLTNGELRLDADATTPIRRPILAPDTLLGALVDPRTVEPRPALFDLRAGTSNELELPPLRFDAQWIPSPDGKWLAGSTLTTDDRTLKFQVWQLGDAPRLMWQAEHERHVALDWVRLGEDWSLLIHRMGDATVASSFAIHAARDGRLLRTIPEMDGRLWSFDVSDDGRRLLVGKGDQDAGRAAVVDLTTGEETAVIDGFDSWLNSVAFLDDAHLAAGSYRGQIALWDREAGRATWRVEVPFTPQRFHWISASRWLVAQDPYFGGAILDMESGRSVRPLRGSRMSNALEWQMWSQPHLVGDGSRCLETDLGAEWLRLAETESGRTLLTFAPLGNGEWAVYAPNGTWMGSAGAQGRLVFYRGAEPMTDEDIERLRQPEEIERRLAGDSPDS